MRVSMLRLAAAFLAAGCSRPLPEEGTPAATVYAQRCGTSCHAAYLPSLMTGKMWETMVDRMEIEMRRRGRELAAEDKEEILAYLRRNAGGR